MHTGSRDLTLGPGESRTKGPLRGKEANRPRLHVILPDPCEAPILSLRLVRHVPRQASQLSNAYLPDDLAVMSSAGHVSPDEGIGLLLHFFSPRIPSRSINPVNILQPHTPCPSQAHLFKQANPPLHP
jgi:hypothetical protein